MSIMKMIRKDGIWTLTALVSGEVQQFAAKSMADVYRLYRREAARQEGVADAAIAKAVGHDG